MKVSTDESGSTAAIGEKLAGVLRSRSALPWRAPMPISFAAISLGASLSNIGQCLRGRPRSLGQKSAAVVVRLSVERRVQPPLFRVVRRKPRCSVTKGGWLARTVQLKTRLLSWSTRPRAVGLNCSRVPAWKLKINLIEQTSFAPDVHG
jgi:hypothetical protein